MKTKRTFASVMALSATILAGDAVAKQFTIALLPDSQYLVEKFPAVFLHQINWLVSEQAERNIVYVGHLGDMKNDRDCDIVGTENPETGEGIGQDPFAPSHTEWDLIDYAYRKLDHAGIPYGVLPGNHDFDEILRGGELACPRVVSTKGGGTASSSGQTDAQDAWDLNDFDSLFGPETPRIASQYWYGDRSVVPVIPGNRDIDDPATPAVEMSNKDNFTLFEHCGIGFVAINLGYRELAYMNNDIVGTEIDWAEQVLADYSDRIGLVTSHTFMWEKDINSTSRMTGYGGQVNSHLRGNSNLMMMLSAHREGEAWLQDTRPVADGFAAGTGPVHVQLMDYQHLSLADGTDPSTIDFADLTPASDKQGNFGLLRLYVFDTETRQVTMQTLAPRPNPGDPTPGDLLDPGSYIEIVSTYNPALSNAANPGVWMGEFTASSGPTFDFAPYLPANFDFSCATGGNLAPQPFAFAPQLDQPVSGGPWVQSNPIVVLGIDGNAPLGINDSDGAQYSLDGGATWATGPTTVTNGQGVIVRLPRPPTFETTVTTRLTIGGIAGDFSVTTGAEPPPGPPPFVQTGSLANDQFLRFLGGANISAAVVNDRCADGDGCRITLTREYGASTTEFGPISFSYDSTTNQWTGGAQTPTGINGAQGAATILLASEGSSSARCWFSDWDSSTASGVPDRNLNWAVIIGNNTSTLLTCTIRIED